MSLNISNKDLRFSDYISPNINDLLEAFGKTEEEEHVVLPSPNDQKECLQIPDLEQQLILNTKPLFFILSIPRNSIHINSPNIMSKKINLAQIKLTVLVRHNTRVGRNIK